VRRAEGEESDNPTPQPSSAPESEPAISDAAIDSRRNSAVPEGRHRLAVTSRAQDEPPSLDPGAPPPPPLLHHRFTHYLALVSPAALL